MCRTLCILLGVLTVSRLFAVDLSEKYAPLGKLIFTNFASAAFPHEDRGQGHNYHDQFFSAADHYQDSHVAIFVPKDFRPGREVDFVVHFHGWRNNVSNVLAKYQLPEQFAGSHRNAILIVPQGPLDAPDSFDGKLEDTNGFKRFMGETMTTLRQRGVISNGRIGRIILSGHSGGYQVISSILDHGGLTDHVAEVWLFDALYARTEWFTNWFDHHHGRFIDLYTEHGGTKDETETLMAALAGKAVPFFKSDETNAPSDALQRNHLVFLFSELPHDEVLQDRETFRRFLETSSLQINEAKSIRSIDFRNAPEAKALAEEARRIGDEMYPKVRELLSDGRTKLPRQLDIVFRPHLDTPRNLKHGEVLEGCACRETVFLNADWLCAHPELLRHVLIHEMAHVAQNYPRFAYRHRWESGVHDAAFMLTHPFQLSPPSPPRYWVEGIADYIAAKLTGETEFPDFPKGNGHLPAYMNGYGDAASFLIYINKTSGFDTTLRLNAAMRAGKYSDRFFAETTGKTLGQLWNSFQQTEGTAQVAEDYRESDPALGYADRTVKSKTP